MTSSIQKPTPEKVNVLREIWRAGSLEIPNVSLPLNPFIPQTSGDPTFWQLLFRAKQNRSTLYKLITATVIMICAPLLTFFAARSYLFYSYNFNDQLVYSGFAAVLMVNVVSFGFVFFAWFLDPSDDEVPVGPKQKEGMSNGLKTSENGTTSSSPISASESASATSSTSSPMSSASPSRTSKQQQQQQQQQQPQQRPKKAKRRTKNG